MGASAITAWLCGHSVQPIVSVEHHSQGKGRMAAHLDGAKTSRAVAAWKVAVQHDAIHAIITTLQQLAIIAGKIIVLFHCRNLIKCRSFYTTARRAENSATPELLQLLNSYQVIAALTRLLEKRDRGALRYQILK
jgi:hypothetical protein